MSSVSLTIGGSAFHRLLTKKVQDRCIHSKFNGGTSNLLLIPRKLNEGWIHGLRGLITFRTLQHPKMPVLCKIDHMSWMNSKFKAFTGWVSLISKPTLHHPKMPVLCKIDHMCWMRSKFRAFAGWVSLITKPTLHHPKMPISCTIANISWMRG